MLGFYNYTVYLTYAGLLSALAGIFLAMEGNVRAAVICLLVSGVCDLFDGKIARTKKDRTEDEKRFGIQIDSLCDAVCFGALPAVISYASGCVRFWQTAVAALFVLCGVIRLAYFNVTEESRQAQTSASRSVYAGLPITSSAIAVPLFMCFRSVLGGAFPAAFTCLLAVLGICYISPFSVKKPGRKGVIAMLAVGAAVFAFILIFK